MRSVAVLVLLTAAGAVTGCVPALPGSSLTGDEAGAAPVVAADGGPAGAGTGGGAGSSAVTGGAGSSAVTGGGGSSSGPSPDAGPPNPFVFVADAGHPANLAVDSNYLYWVDQTAGAVMKLPLAGGARTPLSTVTATTAPPLVAIDAENVYWIDGLKDSYPDTIYKVGTDGGQPTRLWVRGAVSAIRDPNDEPLSIKDLAVTDAYAFFLADANELIRVGLTDQTPVLLAAETVEGAWEQEVVADDRNVYWISQTNDHLPNGEPNVYFSLHRVSVGGGEPVELVRSYQREQGWIGSLVLDSMYVYWLQQQPRAIMRMALDGDVPEPVFTDVTGAGCLAVDDTGVYWADTSGAIFVRTSSGDTRAIAAGDPGTQFITLDATAVYWIAGNSIYRAPKQ